MPRAMLRNRRSRSAQEERRSNSRLPDGQPQPRRGEGEVIGSSRRVGDTACPEGTRVPDSQTFLGEEAGRCKRPGSKGGLTCWQ